MTRKDRGELRRLYPELPEEKLEVADETLTRYAELVVRMVERRAWVREDRSSENSE